MSETKDVKAVSTAPTLIVGLGGTGSKIVQKVYKQATPRQRQNIGFVVFDTDVNELREIEARTPQIHTVQTSTRLTVGEYLDVDRYSRDTWFPVNKVLNGKALTEGAGQVRAVSRLALNTAIQQGKMAPLDEAIEQLYKLKGQRLTQAPRVILVGSLCGGTGSGLILPVSMYIRNFMTTRLQQGSAIIRGFFLLPEVFYGVVKTQSEQNNLRSNAYAAVREIDAFMRKDDGSLPEQYDLHFIAPRAGSSELDEYTGKPMDFCFLFDAQNLNGMQLNSFAEYQEHAANCIYGMAIAPTSKRSNSSEDNVIREIVYNGGRNRFAGSGSSLLIYPYDDVKKYLTLRWAKESITDEWLEVDNQYHEEQETNRSKRHEGVAVAELKRYIHYVKAIDREAAERKPFGSSIRNLCISYEPDGFVERGTAWDQYLASLNRYLDGQITVQKRQIGSLLDSINAQLGSLGDKGNKDGDDGSLSEQFLQLYKTLLGYKNATINSTAGMSQNLIFHLFKDKKDRTHTEDKFRLEYWMHKNGDKDKFIHPNAIRYLLCNLLGALQSREYVYKQQVGEIESYWATFEEETFDMPQTENHVETPDEFFQLNHMKETTRWEAIVHSTQIKQAKGKLRDAFGTFNTETDRYWNSFLYADIYRAAIQYVEGLCAAFDSFYDALAGSIATIDRDMEQLERKYITREGQARRYVCADAECLNGLAKEVRNTGTALDLPDALNAAIFNRMKSYALSEKKPDGERYFIDTFKDTVMGNLEAQILDQHESKVNMDILKALQTEAMFKTHGEVSEVESDEARRYARDVIESTEILAQPFIESPVGKEPRVISACAYSPELEAVDAPMRREFVARYLKDGGGVEDATIERNMILFYKAVYDLRANDLSKFAPPKKADTYERQGGEYYKAYYELVQNIHPETNKSKVITPHIDRWWHIITMLPDLDEGSQERQEKAIYCAFFWGVLAHYVHQITGAAGQRLYAVDTATMGVQDDALRDPLIVSNGTTCDHLYEVQDAFTIYPYLVNIVTRKIRERIDSDLYDKKNVADSVLPQLLSRFEIEEYPLEATAQNPGRVRSVFELPMLIKRSTPTELYHDSMAIEMFNTILGELEDYMRHFCHEKEFAEEYGALLKQQYDLFVENAMAENKPGRLAIDSLFPYLCKVIANTLNDLGLTELAEQARQQMNTAIGK